MKLKLAYVTHYSYPSISAALGVRLSQLAEKLVSWNHGAFKSQRQNSKEASKFLIGRWFVFPVHWLCGSGAKNLDLEML